MDGEKNIAAKGKAPPTSLRSLPPRRVGLTEPARPEGLSPYTITALLKNLPYFFKKSLYGLDFRRLFCYNS